MLPCGYEKELILSESQKEVIREKIRANKQRRQEEESKELSDQKTIGSSIYSPPPSSSSSSSIPPDAFISQPLSIVQSELDQNLPGITESPPLVPLSPSLEQYCDQLLAQNETSLIGDDIIGLLEDGSNSRDIALDQMLVPYNPSNRAQWVRSKPSYDSILEFTPYIAPQGSVGPDARIHSYLPTPALELGFPVRELIQPEKYLLLELTQACAILQNPYKRYQYFQDLELSYSDKMTEYTFYRLIRACKQLSAFGALSRTESGLVLKKSLLKLLQIRSVLMYNRDRDSWCFVDDNQQTTIVFRMDYIEPHCSKCGYDRHKQLPGIFRDEWKSDNVIFDLLTAIILFTPWPEYANHERIRDEHSRYKRLLQRYLRIKYPTSEEADECFHKLMRNLDEIFELNDDILNFFMAYQELFQENPFFVELLDLNVNSGARNAQNSVDQIVDISNSTVEILRPENSGFSQFDMLNSFGLGQSTAPLWH